VGATGDDDDAADDADDDDDDGDGDGDADEASPAFLASLIERLRQSSAAVRVVS
jgi:hypothetical protein